MSAPAPGPSRPGGRSTRTGSPAAPPVETARRPLRARSAALWIGWPAALLLAAAACTPPGETPGARGGETADPAAAAATLVPVPEPDLSRLEPVVAEQLGAGAAALAAATAASPRDPADLGRRFGELGMLYLAYGLDPPAAACFENARRLLPGEARWHYYRGQALRDGGEPGEAIAAFRRTLELDPGHRPATVALGLLLIETDRAAEAAALYDAALAGADGDPALHAGRGRAALAARDFPLAVRHLERALALAPEASELHYPLGLAYRGTGDDRRAREQLARRGGGATPLDDPLMAEVRALASGARVLNNRGNEAFLAGRFEEAAAQFRRAVETDPDDADFRHNLAAALARLGRPGEAAAQLEELLARHPDYALGHFTLGTLRAREGRDADAIAHYRRALELNPDHRDSHFNLANALRRGGRAEPAVEHYRRASELAPGDPHARYGEATTLIALGRWRPAVERLEAAHRALPDDPVLAATLARVLASCPRAELRDGPRALELAQRLVAADNSLGHAELLAMALAEVGRFDLAVRQQEAALAAARAAGRRDLETRLAAGLERYRRGEPARLPEGG